VTYFVLIMGLLCVLGGLAVASNPSPYYEVLGLVLASVVGCGCLMSLGLSSVALVLFMLYLNEMLMVFAYSVALVADLF
ncbi:NU6M oxidoreductase, partial [Upupa epops]|nr:NU6M oxidoreductase [Upupa epops]